MSYTCPDCEDGILVAKVREIQIIDDETAEIVDSRIRITSVGCNNGCSSQSEEEEEPAGTVDCGKAGCKKKGPHRHYGKRKVPA